MRSFDGIEARGAALVTGASRGLGFALAEQLKKRGFELILHGRDGDALKDAAEKLGAAYYTADLSQDGAAEALYWRIKADGFTLSVLVNNAGLGASGEAWTVPGPRDTGLIAVNVAAATKLTKLFLKDACGRGYGALLNVCSVGAFQPGPYTASYYASKAYLHSYTLAVREEAKKYGVTVCSLCPGPLDTEFFERAGVRKPRGAMSAEKAAEYAVKKFSKGKKTIVPGFLNRLARAVPAALRTRFVASLKKPG
ncbi:MAG: SDR family NAD(P)-dependent oxidoreductase [Clostridia bacterium]|nr:SDR family NAD(P)-dependent oxidoreductase [Clostridia bacterium]